MKKSIYFLILLLSYSCSIQKSNTLNNKKTDQISTESKLIETEGNIVNDFIDVELKKDRYKNYKDSEIVVIKEALKKYKSIEAYQYSHDEWISMDRINKILP